MTENPYKTMTFDEVKSSVCGYPGIRKKRQESG